MPKTAAGPALEKLLTPEEAAEMLGLPSAKTLHEWRWRGKGPTSVKAGKYVRYHPEDIRDYVNANRHASAVQQYEDRHAR